ncbi:MAG: hypothetical protein LIP23_01740, partial [Planctomycetes bacterium]|nr:hypothetical protein [Planctomycetota bacterium]
MSAVKTVIKSDIYRDSIFLMKLSAQAAKDSGVEAVSAMMATDRNKDLFEASGLMTPEIQAAQSNDLAIAIKGDDDKVEAAIAAVMRLLDAEPDRPASAGGCGVQAPATLDQAAKKDGKLNLALISVAGDYARYEASRALANGMDVMLYSDNISIADELNLKKLAAKKGLMVMGPDCGTAIIDGVPLAFANSVAKGPLGVVGASGTGLQEVCCLLDRLGVGISQAYGTGGRDLKDDIGGITALAAIDRLADDPETKALVILGKPPGNATRAKILDRCRQLGRPVFFHYIGASDYQAEEAAGFIAGQNLTELALAAAKHFKPDAALDGAADAPARPKVKPGFLVGIFGGGTLAQESAEICGRILPGEKASNLTVAGFKKIAGKDTFAGHVFWDLGEDEFTVGRPHPMMAPDLKMDRVVDALCDPAVSVVLVDMVIGYGSHPAQADLMVEALNRAAEQSAGKSRDKLVVASVCGTEGDRPSR